MNSFYAEYMVKRKKSLMDYLIVFMAIVSGVFATLFLLPLLFLQIYGMLAFLLVAVLWFIVFKIVASRNIEYEYCVTENVLDVDIITGKQKRKSLVSINLKNAEIIAPATVEYESQYNRQGIDEKYIASMFDNDVLDFFVIFADDSGRICRLLFTPDRSVLDMIKRANPSHTFFE